MQTEDASDLRVQEAVRQSDDGTLQTKIKIRVVGCVCLYKSCKRRILLILAALYENVGRKECFCKFDFVGERFLENRRVMM